MLWPPARDVAPRSTHLCVPHPSPPRAASIGPIVYHHMSPHGAPTGLEAHHHAVLVAAMTDLHLPKAATLAFKLSVQVIRLKRIYNF
jgi:hypothetical protein